MGLAEECLCCGKILALLQGWLLCVGFVCLANVPNVCRHKIILNCAVVFFYFSVPHVSFFLVGLSVVWLSIRLAVNVLRLPEGGDFEALHCQPSRNYDRCTKLDLTTEPPLLGRCCCAFVVFLYPNFCPRRINLFRWNI